MTKIVGLSAGIGLWFASDLMRLIRASLPTCARFTLMIGRSRDRERQNRLALTQGSSRESTSVKVFGR